VFKKIFVFSTALWDITDSNEDYRHITSRLLIVFSENSRKLNFQKIYNSTCNNVGYGPNKYKHAE